MTAAAFNGYMFRNQQRNVHASISSEMLWMFHCASRYHTNGWRIVTHFHLGVVFSMIAKSSGKVMSSMTLVNVPGGYGVARP